MGSRNQVIDAGRVAAMLAVICCHALLYFVRVGDGSWEVVPWAPGPVMWWLTWVFALLPLFFVAAGFGAAAALESVSAGYITRRVQALASQLAVNLALFAGVGTAFAWFWSAAAAAEYSARFGQLFWFLVVYLLLTAAAPVLARTSDRVLSAIAAALVPAIAAVDYLARDAWDLHWLNLVLVWPLAFIWGMGYRRGWLRAVPTWGLAVLAAACYGVIALLVGFAGYPVAAVAWADALVANIQPPTLAMVPLSLAQLCLLAIADRLWTPRFRWLRAANALVFPAYLWHIWLIIAANAGFAGLAMLWPAASGPGWSQWAVLAFSLALVAATVPLLARVRLPIPRISRTRATAAYVFLTGGLFALWQFGAVLHPATPEAALAVLLTALGLAAALARPRRGG
ncbi:MAG: acyltransferase family protein [Propionibacteriaceae bacterium]|jgi:surface polysaccharide O-acyltransferase-like enzyme|nr:acyltransferase family protein [Propionibacteriaceae bacterium]